MRIRLLGLWCVFLLAVSAPAAAQTVSSIAVGETTQGAVSSADPAPSFFFETAGPLTLLARVQVSPDQLVPVLLAADSTNTVISTVSASPGMRVLESQFAVPAAGRYFVQVQGVNGSQGLFSLSLLDVNALTPTPTPAPPTATASPAQALALGQTLTGEVSVAAPEQRFSLTGTNGGLVVRLDSPSRGAPGYPAFTLLDATGEPLATLTGGLRGGTLVLPPAEGTSFTLVARHSGGEVQPFRVALFDALTYLVLESEALARLNAPAATPSPALQPTEAAVFATGTPAAPPPVTDSDLLLRWDGSALTLTNVSGGPVNLSTFSMTGNNRTVDSSYWARSNPALNLAAVPNGSCVGLRPLAYPDAPPLPPVCNDLGAWWSADIVYVWGSESFDVFVNGQRIATCPSAPGQCAVDLPDA